MGWFPGVRRWFRLATRRRDTDDEVQTELEYHLERCEEDLRAGGMTPQAAWDEARRRFGQVEMYSQQLRTMAAGRRRRDRWARVVEVASHDLKYALRSLGRAPVLSAGIIATLALGIGANATMFGVIDRVLLSAPPHIVDADRVTRLYSQQLFNGNVSTSRWFTYPDYWDLTAASSFSSVAAYARDRVTLGSGEDAIRVDTRWISASFLPLLGVTMEKGRPFGPADDSPTAAPSAIIGHAFWLRYFGGDPDVVGRVIPVGQSRYTIVGVAPPGFTGVDLEPVDLWLPVQFAPDYAMSKDHRNWYWIHVVARLTPGVSMSAAQAEATTLHRRARSAARNEDYQGSLVVAPLQTARGPEAPDEAFVAQWLALVSVIVLIVACANVANLLLARGMQREREIGVRLALGAGRGRVVAQLLTESLLLAVIGGGSALLVARWGSAFVGALLVPGAAWGGTATAGRVIGFTLTVATLTGIGAGVIPAFLTARTDVQSALKVGLRSSGSRSRTRVVLLVAQGALSVVLLVGAGLFVRSLAAIREVDLGFEPQGIAVVTLEGQPGDDPAVLESAYDRVRERLLAHPAVVSAAATQATPFRNSMTVSMRIPGRDSLPRPAGGGPYVYSVSSDFLSTMGIRIVRGRPLLDTDRAGAPPVVVMNETLARLYWPGEDPIGKCVIIDGDENDPCVTVVGVAEDSRRQRVIEGSEGQYYVARDQEIVLRSTTALLVRTTLPEEQVGRTLRQQVFALGDAGIRFVRVDFLRSYVDPQFRSWELGATMFTLFGLLALVVAAVGLYSVLAFEVTRRTRELGIRAALGARATTLVTFVMRDGLRLASLGLTVGIALTLGSVRVIQPLLFQVSPRDPLVFGVVIAVLLAVAAVASLIPAVRATRVVPSDALRAE